MSSTRSKLNRPKRRRETTYRRGYDDGKLAAQRELGVRWLPIEQADRSITDVQDFSEVGVMLRLSDRYWVRDEDGRIYEAVWTDDKNGYWWDLEGESTVDPVEFMPHPQDTRFVGSAALCAVKSMELPFHCDVCSAPGYGDAPCSPICDRPVPTVAVKALQAIANYRHHSRLDSDENAEAMEQIARSALSAQVQDAPEKVGRFGHHHEPAIDFCIEVEALEGHLFDAKHGIGKPGHEQRRIDDEFRRRVSSAMDFIVGGDQIAIAAKATLRSISAQVQDVAGLENNPITLRWWCQQLLDIIENYDISHESPEEELALINDISAATDPAAPAKQGGGADGC